MKLSEKEVKHIANLAHLELSEKEIGIFKTELSDILSYIDQLKDVKDSGAEATHQISGLKNVWREDEVRDCEETERNDALQQSKYYNNGDIKVKRVLN